MIQLSDVLNKKLATRSLTDHDFELAVPHLAKELEAVSFYPDYSDVELRRDWDQLCSWTTDENDIRSTSRLGMKLSEQYCTNFFDIENHKGSSFRSLWTAPNLEKILRWNRKSHTTPYLSELKRGIYFCCGLPKSTMYRPQMMKMACIKYNPRVVIDPCAGWGGRMLGAVSYGADYIAFEPNTTTYQNLQKIVKFLNIDHKVTLICDDARNMDKYNLPKADMILTSPPYFNLEVYAHEETQSISKTLTYQEWADNFLKEIIGLGIKHLNQGGVSCWNVGKVGGRDMSEDVAKYHKEFSYESIDVLTVSSSKRQINQKTVSKNQKNTDNTVIYKKLVG